MWIVIVLDIYIYIYIYIHIYIYICIYVVLTCMPDHHIASSISAVNVDFWVHTRFHTRL
jgi:hypothetical protein